MGNFVVKSDKLTKWQKSLINNYSMGEKPKVKYPDYHKPKVDYQRYKRGELKDIEDKYNQRFEKEWEEAKKLILEERKQWEYKR